MTAGKPTSPTPSASISSAAAPAQGTAGRNRATPTRGRARCKLLLIARRQVVCYKAIEQGRSCQRGPVAKSDAHNLHERLVVQRKNVLRFTRLTNNRSERDIRMAKVKQKVSGCFRTVSFAHAYCRISSYLQTMAALGYNPLVATTIALHGNAVDCLNQDNE